MQQDNFDDFLHKLVQSELLSHLASGSKLEAEKIRYYLEIAISEARHMFYTLRDYDFREKRILEVGTGFGLFSSYLSSIGAEVTALEPGESGFEHYRHLSVLLNEYFDLNYRLVNIKIEDLNIGLVGAFDYIFSNNVLEHVDDFRTCLITLQSILKPLGQMIHNCPNYFVPYEPHFGIPLLPFFPQLTKYFLPKRITDSDCWRSLNFISAWQVQRLAMELNKSLHFHKNLLEHAILRLEGDFQFGERHKFLKSIFPLMKVFRISDILRLVPPKFVTPMVFVWTNN